MLVVISVSKVRGQPKYVARSHQCSLTAERPTRMEAAKALQAEILQAGIGGDKPSWRLL